MHVRLYRDGIADAVSADPRFCLVGTASSPKEAEQRIVALDRPPDVMLVDLGLPDGAAVARAWSSTVSVVALAVPESDDEVLSWASAGVAGLVSRNATLPELLDAIDGATRDELHTSPAVASALLRRVVALAGEQTHDGPALTGRERQIVGLIDRGLSNKEIAGALHIEVTTVKNHVHHILEKMQVVSRAEAVSVARARGDLV
jgi:two-component system, NarL family, nitrate/nitrite response regulator NarL